MLGTRTVPAAPPGGRNSTRSTKPVLPSGACQNSWRCRQKGKGPFTASSKMDAFAGVPEKSSTAPTLTSQLWGTPKEETLSRNTAPGWSFSWPSSDRTLIHGGFTRAMFFGCRWKSKTFSAGALRLLAHSYTCGRLLVLDFTTATMVKTPRLRNALHPPPGPAPLSCLNCDNLKFYHVAIGTL